MICLAAALILMLVLMPALLKKLRAMKMGQTIYELGPKAHLNKQGTPNMGGILIGGITVLILIVTQLIKWRTQGGPFIEMPLLFVLLLSCGAMAMRRARWSTVITRRRLRRGRKSRQVASSRRRLASPS